MKSGTFKIWLVAIALFWAVPIGIGSLGVVASMLLAAPQSTIPVLTTVTKTESDPALDHRRRAAVEMLSRIGELKQQLTAKCEQYGSPRGCEIIKRPWLDIAGGIAAATEDEVKFAKAVDIVHTFEKETTKALQDITHLECSYRIPEFGNIRHAPPPECQ